MEVLSATSVNYTWLVKVPLLVIILITDQDRQSDVCLSSLWVRGFIVVSCYGIHYFILILYNNK